MRLLDLFCGAGGAAVGYHRAGFTDIVGVDTVPQPRYPFTFVQADAMTYPLDGFDAIHASPPCQGYSSMRHLPWLAGRTYPMLLEPTWARLAAHGAPFVIENVERAPMPWSIVLCGRMFDLPLYRHRRFGSNLLLLSPPHVRHEHVILAGRRNLGARYRSGGGSDVTGVIPSDRFIDGRGYSHRKQPGSFGLPGPIEVHRNSTRHLGTPKGSDGTALTADRAREAMGIDWMRRDELTQAIPPAYTEFIGAQLLTHIRAAAA